jgi:hypothetical protein
VAHHLYGAIVLEMAAMLYPPNAHPGVRKGTGNGD